MRHLLLIIGEDLRLHKNFLSYIYEEYEKKFKEINELKLLAKNDKNLPFFLETWIKEYDFISIFSNASYYAIIAKICATLNRDSLVLKENHLIPSKALNYEKDSFIMRLEKCKLSLVKAVLNEKLPKFLQEVPIHFDFFLLKDLDEESVQILLQTLIKSYEVHIELSSLLENLVLVKASVSEYGKLEAFFKACQKLFAYKMIATKNLYAFIIQHLAQKELKISFAESCTAGLCAVNLTDIDGASQVFEGSLITYSNRLKHEWLGISESMLENGGQYSEKCIYFMLKGVFKTTKVDFALALSGVAGEKDSPHCKSGRVFIGAMYKDGTFLQESLVFKGSRKFIRAQATLAAFVLLLKLKPEIFS